ncbi:uL15 family ribosomal protein [Ignisphaera sp. 4213-co]|uniref:Large ribosomal subunit protein uL15 n=1 Tax=Ignisphaera cupida TaxID=3050454 RepID=A0ABD4Z3N9_9CREN|nr:uL15 family ribosomal protein [Ignisphaera sp. 4213-co]MDK6027937.1 uL15 family ribosomal protein [Ignisphaera sp. 4213-co]
MVVRREKKSRKMHGYRNRGWGSIGQHRKSGSRGGRGAAGMHKHKWSWVMKYFKDWFGKKGFVPRGESVKVRAINISDLNEIVKKMIQSNTAVTENGKIVVDLSKMGINKLLGSGSIEFPVKVLVSSYSKKAKEKVEKIGGVIQKI